MGHIVVSSKDLIEAAEQFVDMDKVLALLLKERGVPMIGSHFFPQPDHDQYTFEINEDPQSDNIIVIWKSK